MKLIGPFTQIITLNQLPLKGSLSDNQLEIIENGGVVVENGWIVAVGKYQWLADQYPEIAREFVNEKQVLLPGFIDCHTHICFAGSRARDYALRLSGVSYIEIAKQGGGIQDTVRATRKASKEELAKLTHERAQTLLQNGVTTIEVKSGYGLTVEEELKMLFAIRDAAASSTADIIPTCLAAHLKPSDFEGSELNYLEHIVQELFPVLKTEKLTNRMDIFVEESAFNLTDSEWFLNEAKKAGFELTVHADQFSAGGSEIAVKAGALSAEHLEASSEKEIQLLAASNTVATVLPGASLGLGMHFAPARKLLDAGCCVAIASDWNPGSAPMGDLITQTALLGAYEKLTLAECLAGITYRAAKALNLSDRGVLSTGKIADFQSYPTSDFRDIFYLQGAMKPHKVWKKGIAVQIMRQ